MEATTATLIMLDKPILVNEEQPVNGYYYDTFIGKIRNTNKAEYAKSDIVKQIIAGHEGTKRLTFNLSEEDAKKIGYFDVKKLAYQHRRSYQDSFEGMNECIMNDAIHQQIGFVKGFETALSLTPKKYTEEEARAFFDAGTIFGCNPDSENDDTKEFESIKSKLNQPQQFKVEYTETETEAELTKIL